MLFGRAELKEREITMNSKTLTKLNKLRKQIDDCKRHIEEIQIAIEELKDERQIYRISSSRSWVAIPKSYLSNILNEELVKSNARLKRLERRFEKL